MKIKLCLASTCLFLIISCMQAPTVFPEYINLAGIDFSKYADQGFLFTPNKYGGDYKSIGLITLTHSPGAKLLELSEISALSARVGQKEVLNNLGGPSTGTKRWVISQVEVDSLLQSVYEECVRMGADAFTQMEFTTEKISMPSGMTYPLTLTETTVSGYAIKRLGAYK